VVSNNGSGVNTQALSAIAPPVLGDSMQLSLDCTGFPLAMAITRIPWVAGTPFLMGGDKGEILVELTPGTGFNYMLPHLGASASSPVMPIPLLLAIYGTQLYAQGYCGSGSVLGAGSSNPAGLTNYSNLLEMQVGSQL
jgi:hypothetical protein